MTSAPWEASSRARSESALRVSARAVNGPAGSARIARTRPPPWAPVAPTTAMIFFSVIIYSCDLLSDTDPELPRRIEDLVSPRRDPGPVAGILIRLRKRPAVSVVRAVLGP